MSYRSTYVMTLARFWTTRAEGADLMLEMVRRPTLML